MTRFGTALLAALVTAGSAFALAQQPRDARIASADHAEVCATDGLPGSAYSRAHRVVKRKPVPGRIIDHAIPLCIGGADVDANILIQTRDEAAAKDAIERAVCIAVCRKRTMTLPEGQAIFATGRWRELIR
jgi:hypothetical protein